MRAIRWGFAAPAALLAALAAAPLAAQAVSTTVTVPGSSNLWRAGVPAQPGEGDIPPAVAFGARAGRVLRFAAVTGTSDCCGGFGGFTGPEGSVFTRTIAGINGIAGITAPRSHFLAGLFLAGGPPAATPPLLDFTAIGTDFATLSPALGQPFFIGDGRTGSGARQRFLVPDGASGLFLGIPDACGIDGPPGCYDDNVGAYVAGVRISPGGASGVAPEPASLMLLGSGLAGVAGALRRRRPAARPAADGEGPCGQSGAAP